MITVVRGSSRFVILTDKYAFKIPYLTIYKNFLWGLLANINEVEFNKINDPRLAKILFSLPLGLLVVMYKAKPLNFYCHYMLENFINKGDFPIPSEIKRDSFGYIDGKMVAIDYGG